MTADDHTVVSRLIELSRGRSDAIAELERFRRSITIMFTDIRGSTAYYEKFGDVAGLIMVHECNHVLREVVEQHQGSVLKTIGDAIMARFESCRQAVQAAIAMQQKLAAINASKPDDDKTLVRIGLHYGNGIVKSNDVFGDVVNVASRIESVAHPGQIVISDSVAEQVRDCNYKIGLLGRFQLKGKEGDCALFEVIWGQKISPQPAATHSVVIGSAAAGGKFKLQLVTPQGGVAREYELNEQLSVGRSEGDLTFPADSIMAPLSARISVDNGQVFVENLSREGRVFVRLVSVYMLQSRDVVMMGSQLFQFHETAGALALKAAMGETLANMTAMLEAPVAQFIALNADGSAGASYPLNEEEVRFGRAQATYTFPNDRLLSHTHARVYQRGENLFLEDTNSRNGTFVKVRGKTPVPLGATILVGHQLLRLSG